MRVFCLLLTFQLATCFCCPAQEEKRKPFEAGLQFSGVHLNALAESPAGIGGRTSYEFTRGKLIFAPELEFNYFPQNPSGNFGESQLLAGARIGIQAGRVGIFLKARPGFVHFGGDDFKSRNNGATTAFATDLGVVIEYPASKRIGIRVDFGDTLIDFSRPVFTGASAVPNSPGVSHNFQGGVGIVFRF
jgi:hypothetical protein